VALDETKVEANAALDANRTASSIEEQIGRMLAEAEATDAREVRQFGAEMSKRESTPSGLRHHPRGAFKTSGNSLTLASLRENGKRSP
jgi:hypothetical protein